MKFGAEPKKIAVLGGLIVVAAYFYISGRSDDAPASAPRPAAAQTAAGRIEQALPEPNIDRPVPVTRSRRSNVAKEFRPRLGGSKGGIDPIKMDPTLRLDLLTKVQDVKMEGGSRNLFQFGAAPAPKVPEVKVPVKTGPGAPVLATGAAGALPNTQLPKPPPPAIPLKFYGYVSKNRASTDKRAFFIEGEDIFVAGEGETIKQRYKVIRIGINSAVVEDVQFSHQQTLPLEEQAG